MNLVIIGLGSIGRKHIDAIRSLRPDAAITALRSAPAKKVDEDGIIHVTRWEELPADPDFILISNPTHLHGETILRAVQFGVPLFIEKPPLHTLDEAEEILKQIKAFKIRTYTAFNMRFLPLLQWLRKSLEHKRVLEATIYCGSWLPDWRKGRDYRQIYSAHSEMGGGVHLDLIHELDYMRWLFGDPEEGFRKVRNVSDLEISSPDYAHYSFFYPGLSVSVTLNYYRRDTRRTIEIILDDNTWVADLLAGSVTDMHGNQLFLSESGIADTYRTQMDYFLETLERGEPFNNSLEESLQTLKLCLA